MWHSCNWLLYLSPLVVDCLSVFNDMNFNAYKRITYKWYYFIFHYIQNQVLLPVLRLYLSQMEMVGNTGLGCCV